MARDPMDDLAPLDLPPEPERASGRSLEEYNWDRWAASRKGSGSVGQFRGIMAAEKFSGDPRKQDMSSGKWMWSHDAQQFYKDGKAISPGRVTQVMRIRQDDTARAFGHLTDQYGKGKLTIDQLEAKGSRLIERATREAGMLAHGGGRLEGQAARTVVGGTRVQQAYWGNFMGELRGGAKFSDAQLARRAGMYGTAGPRSVYETERMYAMAAAGYDECERGLASAKPCLTCEAQALRGWHSITTQVPLGDSECDGACKCYMEYRMSVEKPFTQIPSTRMGDVGDMGFTDCPAAVDAILGGVFGGGG